jgi:DNA-binding transcriptional regulator YiaG
MATQRKTAKKKATSKTTVQKSVKVKAKNALRMAFSSSNLDVREIRTSFGLPRNVFSRLSHFSERAIADWETGQTLSGQSRQRMIELKRLQEALATVVKSDYVGQWLQAPNKAFDGLKPLEVIERGETDRIWRMIHLLESGVPS